MKYFLIVVLSFMTLNAQDLNQFRDNFAKATNDKNLCERMINQAKTKNNAQYIAYLGAYQTIWANHVGNPVSKLSTFNKGKKNIEKAFTMNHNDIEIRAIRYSIQSNAPKFLGYYKDLESDKKFINTNLEKVVSKDLKKFINQVL